MSSLSLGEALPAEMARVRDEVLPEYLKIAEGRFAAALMRRALDGAAKSMAEGDVVGMLAWHEELKGFSL